VLYSCTYMATVGVKGLRDKHTKRSGNCSKNCQGWKT